MSMQQTVALFGGVLLFNLAVCLPILLSSSLRRLVNKLPSDYLVLNYTLGVACFALLQSVLLVTILAVSGSWEGPAAFWLLGGVILGVAILFCIITVFLFPRISWWNPKNNEDEMDGRFALTLGLIWYLVSAGIGLFFLVVLLIALFFPG